VTVAVQIGLVLASLFFIYRVSELTQVERIALDGLPPEIGAHKVFGSLFFGSVAKLEPLLDARVTPERILILELHQVISLDNTALDTLDALLRALRARGGDLLLCGLNRHPAEQIARSTFGAALGAANVVPHLAAALIRAQAIAATTSTPPTAGALTP
jgi:sulfate permease, SulP family